MLMREYLRDCLPFSMEICVQELSCALIWFVQCNHIQFTSFYDIYIKSLRDFHEKKKIFVSSCVVIESCWLTWFTNNWYLHIFLLFTFILLQNDYYVIFRVHVLKLKCFSRIQFSLPLGRLWRCRKCERWNKFSFEHIFDL
jgi:hypothetical protein